MPLYEFRCRQCDRVFEELVSLSSARPIICPSCSSGEVSRLMSRFSAVSKGASGTTRSITSSGCSGCSKSSCSGCGG